MIIVIFAIIFSFTVLTVILIKHVNRWPLKFSLKNIGYYDRNVSLYLNSNVVKTKDGKPQKFKIPTGKNIYFEISDTENNTINPSTNKNFTRNEITDLSFRLYPSVEADIHCPVKCPTSCADTKSCSVHTDCNSNGCVDGDCNCICNSKNENCCCLPAHCPDIDDINNKDLYPNPDIWCIGKGVKDVNDPGFGFTNSIEFIGENIPKDITITKNNIANTSVPLSYLSTVSKIGDTIVSSATEGSSLGYDELENKWPPNYKGDGIYRPYANKVNSNEIWNDVSFYNIKFNTWIPCM